MVRKVVDYTGNIRPIFICCYPERNSFPLLLKGINNPRPSFPHAQKRPPYGQKKYRIHSHSTRIDFFFLMSSFTIMTNRDNYISIAKAIGIILMVMGHCGIPGIICKLIYQFHMPLFFFASGIFMKSIQDSKSLLMFYKMRFNSIYIKFLCWSLLFLFLHNIFYYLNIYNSIVLFHGEPSNLYDNYDYIHKAIQIITTMNGHELLVRSFWFLKQLLLSSILIATVIFAKNKLFRYKYAEWLLLLLLISLTQISKAYSWSIPAIWDISLVLMSCSFYISGFIFHKFRLLSLFNNYTSLIIATSISLIGLFTLPWTNMLEYTSSTTIPFFLVAYSGIIITLVISRAIEKGKTKTIFYYIGQNTMVIFVLHMLCFKIGNLIKIAIYNMPIYRLADFQIIEDHNSYFWVIYTTIGVTIPLMIDYYLKHNKVTNKIWRYFV